MERRVLLGLPFDSPMLGDEFLLKCLFRYTKLIVILHRPLPPAANKNETCIEPFDASDVFQEFIEWTTMYDLSKVVFGGVWVNFNQETAKFYFSPLSNSFVVRQPQNNFW